MPNKKIEKMLLGLNIPVVDDDPYMRRLTRMMLTNLGAKSVLEAPNRLAALEAIRTVDPDVMCSTGTCPCSMASRCLFKSRPMVKVGTFCVPQPRRGPARGAVG
jgi:hypothetical protein